MEVAFSDHNFENSTQSRIFTIKMHVLSKKYILPNKKKKLPLNSVLSIIYKLSTILGFIYVWLCFGLRWKARGSGQCVWVRMVWCLGVESMRYSGGVPGDSETMRCQGGGSQFNKLGRVISNRIVEGVTHQSCIVMG